MEERQGLYRVLNSWKKVLKFAQQFSRPGKSLGNRDKVWKKWQNFFKSYNNCFISEIFSRWSNRIQFLLYVCSASLIKLCSCSFFKVSIANLFDNLESGKRSYCFGKSLEKILNFGSKNLFKPWKERLRLSLSNPNHFHLSSLEGCIP